MPHRTFTDSNATSWDVWDVHPSIVERELAKTREGAAERRGTPFALPQRLRDGWLAFRSTSELRRLAPIPAGWDQLSDAELSRLLAIAPRVVRGRDHGGALAEPGAV